jgi:hypothetical protein
MKKGDYQGFKYFSILPILHYLQVVHKCTSYYNLNNFHEYLIQHSLKSGGNKDQFRQVKVHGTAHY